MILNNISCSLKKELPAQTDDTPIVERKITARKAYGIPSGITIDRATSYYPNISRMNAEELFDAQYKDGTKLSDGSKLLRPVILSLGDVEITPLKNIKGQYLVSRTPIGAKAGETTEDRIISEQELRRNKSLCSGTIKKSPNGQYTLNFTDRDGKSKYINADKAECLKILKENLLYM